MRRRFRMWRARRYAGWLYRFTWARKRWAKLAMRALDE